MLQQSYMMVSVLGYNGSGIGFPCIVVLCLIRLVECGDLECDQLKLLSH